MDEVTGAAEREVTLATLALRYVLITAIRDERTIDVTKDIRRLWSPLSAQIPGHLRIFDKLLRHAEDDTREVDAFEAYNL